MFCVGGIPIPEQCGQQDGKHGAQSHDDVGGSVSPEQVCIGNVGKVFSHEVHLQGDEAVVGDVQQ